MQQYLQMLDYIIKYGEDKENRTGIKTRATFGYMMRFNLSEGFPVITTRKIALNAVISELLWFLEGSSDERRLCEILHDSRDERLKTIWTENAQSDYWKHKAQFDGDVGPIYGVQWRHWPKIQIAGINNVYDNHKISYDKNKITIQNVDVNISYIDQIQNIIDKLKNDPNDRRIILSAWNVSDLENMALPPCHLLSQYYVYNNKLSCILYQRSCDAGLGVPFNITSYSLLTNMLAHVCGLGVGEFVWFGADVHVYHNHFDAMHEQLRRTPLMLPTLWLNPDIKNIFDFSMQDIKIENYNHLGKLTMRMVV